jgi:hypothetical protein
VHKTHHKDNIKAKGMAWAKTRIKIKSKDSENSIVSFMGKKRDMSPRIVQMLRKLKKESKAGPTPNLCHNSQPER